YFVAGPWNHGGWMAGSGRRLGGIDFGSDTAASFRREVLAPWLRRWLHGSADPPPAEATVFETGAHRWRRYDARPPPAQERRLFLGADRSLGWGRPTERSVYDRYLSDPANPVPYRRRPISPTFPGPDWKSWRVQDQRFVDRRPDVLSYLTPPLDAPLTVAGEVVADLWASTSG